MHTQFDQQVFIFVPTTARGSGKVFNITTSSTPYSIPEQYKKSFSFCLHFIDSQDNIKTYDMKCICYNADCLKYY